MNFVKNFKSRPENKPVAAKPMSNKQEEQSEALERPSLAFVNSKALRWTKNGKIMFVIDYENAEGQKLAVSFGPEYFQKSLNAEIVQNQ